MRVQQRLQNPESERKPGYVDMLVVDFIDWLKMDLLRRSRWRVACRLAEV